MKKYKVLQAPASPDDLEKLLNEQASQGWELVTSDDGRLVFVQSKLFISDNKQSKNMIRLKDDELTVSEAFELCGIPRTTIRWNIDQGRLAATKKDGIYVIKKSDLKAWIDKK